MKGCVDRGGGEEVHMYMLYSSCPGGCGSGDSHHE